MFYTTFSYKNRAPKLIVAQVPYNWLMPLGWIPAVSILFLVDATGFEPWKGPLDLSTLCVSNLTE